jgi:voltage-gated potassium channel
MDVYHKKHLFRSLSLVLAILLIGTLGYHFIEGWGIWDSFYMTVITITTVGYREVAPLSDLGKAFTVFLIFSGMGAIFYFATLLIQFTIEGELYGSIKRRRWFKQLEEIKNHFIICGFGRVGSHTAEEFAKANIPFLVIDISPDAISLARSLGYLALQGDATDEEILRLAGVERARGMISCLPSDALNLYAILTARLLNPNLYIVSRVEHEEAEEKFIKIGVNKVVSLHSTAGRHMARLALNPSIEGTMDIPVGPNLRILLEGIEVFPSSPCIGKTISDIKKVCGKDVEVIGLKKAKDDNVIWNPQPSTSVEANDILIVAGSTEELLKFMQTKS